MADTFTNYPYNDLTVIVYNFIDMLSHAREEMEVLKELAGDEKAYRSLTKSWFENSIIWETLRNATEHDFDLIIGTDHGSVRVGNPVKVVGDKTTPNLRYKVGRNLKYNAKEVFDVKNPKDGLLPSPNISSTFIFAKNDDFFLYPNNYNYHRQYYDNTFQHGGISMEECIVPIIKLRAKSDR